MNIRSSPPKLASSPPMPRSVRRVLVVLLYPLYLSSLALFTLGQEVGSARLAFFTLSGCCFLGVLGIIVRLFTRKNSFFIVNMAERELDERQRHLRDEAYRIAYVLLVVAIALIAGFGFTRTPGELNWLMSHDAGYGVLGFLLLLATSLPRVVLAWSEPDPLSDEEGLSAS